MFTLEKARIFNADTLEDIITVQFNPNTLEYSASACGQAQKGAAARQGSGTQQEPQTQQSPVAEERGAALSVKLFCHTYAGPDNFTDVRKKLNAIRAYLPAPSGKGRSSSPRITFAWGTLTHTGTLESFQASYQMFAHDGTPVQAEASITIRGEDPDISAESTNQAQGAQSESDAGQEDDADWDAFSWMFD